MNIIKSPPATERPREETTPHPEDIEYPSIPNRNEDDFDEPETNLRTMKFTAERLIQLQNKAKNESPLSEEEQNEFNRGVALLSETASKFAQLQEKDKLIVSAESKTDDVSDWWARRKDNKKESINKSKDDNKKQQKEDEKKKKEDEERKEEEQKIKEEESEGEKKKEQNQNEDSDEIAINLPSEEASIAEAKPVGLAVAGEGGVAASRPVATAVSGKGGLAVARPVGTAIAGVDPDEALLLVYGPGTSNSRPSGDKDKGKVKTKKTNNEVVVHKLIQKYQEM